VTPAIMAFVGDNALITLSGALAVTSKSVGKSKAKGEGITIGLAGIGVILSDSTLSPTINTYIGTGTTISAHDITLQSLQNANADGSLISQGAEAYANASGGGLISANGAESNATGAAMMDSWIGASTVTATGSITVSSLANNRATSNSSGITIGGVAVGAMVSTANSGGSTFAHIESATVKAGSKVSVTADGEGIADSDVSAASGGLVSGGENVGKALVTPDVRSFVAPGSRISAGDIVVTALARPGADASTNGVNAGAAAVGYRR
jgi:hypothetical protein